MTDTGEHEKEKKPLKFKISSALKNIIGSDLINDDFIAVFELVKNSFDAHATKVDITFEDIYGNSPKIIIKDNGKGMNYDDLINKWLFLAYSAKSDGTEEDSFDYRDKITVKRAYAGAKGIGRFSCDRLGSFLYLESTKQEDNPKTEILLTDWEKFEEDLKDEFIDIPVEHETIIHDNTVSLHGTTLEITRIRSDWDRPKFLKLKAALAKLINPNTQEDDNFEITLNVKEELAKDSKSTDYKEVVNGTIQNLIFETLDLKTTKIVSKVHSNDEKKITFSLYEGGSLVYEITEENTFADLHDIELELYFMNQSAKSTFTKRMGVDCINYGHVFVYKNGLRIYPYGEHGEDPFKMDTRKAQGRTRYIGTREVIGYISVNGENNDLRETSSRGDGLIKTKAYDSMYEWFMVSLRRLEKFIIDIVDWGKETSTDDYVKLDDNAQRAALLKLVTNLTRSKNILNFHLAPEIFNILDEKSQGSASTKLTKLVKELKKKDFNKEAVLLEAKSLGQQLQKLKKIKEESEDEVIEKLIENEKLSAELEAEERKGAFQGALIGTDKGRIIGLQHQIFHSSARINRNLHLLIKNLPPEALTEKQQRRLKVISLESLKINSIANFITKANFNLKATEIKDDLVSFITDYINQIYGLEDSIIDSNLTINIDNKNNAFAMREFRPLEVTTVVDNFITNAENAKASQITFQFIVKNNKFIICISDNGIGILEENLDKIFKLGFTTTTGSGIGLSITHDIVTKSMNGEIEMDSIKNPTSFKVTLQ